MQEVYDSANQHRRVTTQQPGIHRLFGRKCRKSMIQRTSTGESLLNNPEYIDSSAENAESLWFSEPAPASHYSTTRNTSTLRQRMQKVYNPANRHCHGILHYTLLGNCIFTFPNGWWMQRIQYQSASGQGSENECGRKSASLYVLCCGTWVS